MGMENESKDMSLIYSALNHQKNSALLFKWWFRTIYKKIFSAKTLSIRLTPNNAYGACRKDKGGNRKGKVLCIYLLHTAAVDDSSCCLCPGGY